MPNSSLRLCKYWIDNINVKYCETFFSKEQSAVSISPTLVHGIEEVDDNNAIAFLSIAISDENGTKPFNLNMTIKGLFECLNWKNDSKNRELLEFTSIQLLFPYLRQAVTTTTTLMNIPGYVLPIINVYDLLKKK